MSPFRLLAVAPSPPLSSAYGNGICLLPLVICPLSLLVSSFFFLSSLLHLEAWMMFYLSVLLLRFSCFVLALLVLLVFGLCRCFSRRLSLVLLFSSPHLMKVGCGLRTLGASVLQVWSHFLSPLFACCVKRSLLGLVSFGVVSSPFFLNAGFG